METDHFDYQLPPERVAVAPVDPRDAARLLILDRVSGARNHATFADLPAHLPPRALLVLNDTRVFPARLRGIKATGGLVEALLTRRVSTPRPPSGAETGFVERWEALVRGFPSRALDADVGGGVRVQLIDRGEGGRALVEVSGPQSSLAAALEQVGEVPLPPYIEAARRRAAAAPGVDDRARYQTVYAAEPGAVAAPTAGLHFTPRLLESIRAAGHELAFVTLHVGPGTFRPVEAADARAHKMDAERFTITTAAAAAIARARAERRRIVAVGTTVVRALEASAEAHDGQVVSGDAETDLFILPGAKFRLVTDLITNFHLPRSTLLMLVAAFAGRDRVLAAYEEAVRLGYRFYSYGDAMFITGGAG